MRIISMHILMKIDQKAIFLKSSFELGFVGYLKRGFVKQTVNFGARTCVSKIKNKETVKVELTDMENTIIYAHVDDNGMATVIITDFEYPENAAKKVLLELQNVFRQKYPYEQIENFKEDQNLSFSQIDEMIKKYQDPKEADKLLKIENDLDEIQNMLTKTMNDLLERGESLDDLMKESEDISSMAYNFYEKSKETNKKCCSIY